MCIRDRREVVASYTDPRIRYVAHEGNRGVTAAKNTGFDHARREWLTTLDSDDELVPHALQRLVTVLRDVDPLLDAISTNCTDSRTGKFSGSGLSAGYIDLRSVIEHARGEHWGVFRARVLGSRRFDERIKGFESTLWHRIFRGARWYHLQEGLRIYHTEGDDRLTAAKAGDYERYKALFECDPEYLTLLRGVSSRAFRRFVWNAAGQFVLAGDQPLAAHATAMLRADGAFARPTLLSALRRLAPASSALARLVRR
jgi:glycosyltransferase involved in cell wall biosynthesis